MSSIAKSVAKNSIQKVLTKYADNQINLASLSAREMIAETIVEEISKKIKMSIHVINPAFIDKTLTVDMEYNDA